MVGQDGLQVPGVANPIVFSETCNVYEKPSPQLGDGTSHVLGGVLGLSEAELADLRQRKVIG